MYAVISKLRYKDWKDYAQKAVAMEVIYSPVKNAD